MNINNLIELDELARKDGRKYKKQRLLYKTIQAEKGKHFNGIIGPRGAGKTILLKQIAQNNDKSFYISLDTLDNQNLFDIAKHLRDYLKVKTLLLDEIHFQKNYAGELKKIYDFLDIKIIFTSSVALALTQSAFDLSRRVKLIPLPVFSFREYIYFKTDNLLPVLTLENIIRKDWHGDHLRWGYLFKEYLCGGLLPFSLEEPNPLPLFSNILEKILERDIPSITSIFVEEIALIRKMFKFIAKSSVDGINYSSIARNIGITKYKAQSYLELLADALVLHIIFPKGANVLREPKVLLSPPYRLLHSEYEYSIGGLREDFFAEMLTSAKIDFHYLKSTRGKKTPDFLVKDENGDIVLEIGGKGKGRSQFKGIKTDRKLIFYHHNEEAHTNDDSLKNAIDKIRRPLFLLGFLY